MELQQLKYFCAVAECQNMTKAANTVLVSQPSLSKAIKNLEDELGVSLFDRAGKYIFLNDIGALFYKRVSKCIKLLDDAVDEVNDVTNNYTGKISVVIKCGHIPFNDFYTKFTDKYPRISLEIANYSIFEQRSIEDFDFAITGSMCISPQMDMVPLIREDLVIVVPENHPLSKRDKVWIKELETERFIGLWLGSNSERYFSQLCHAAEITPSIHVRSKNLDQAIDLVEQGAGIAFLPYQTLLPLLKNRKVHILHVQDNGSYRILKLVWPKENYMSNVRKAFIAYATEYFKEYQKAVTQ